MVFLFASPLFLNKIKPVDKISFGEEMQEIKDFLQENEVALLNKVRVASIDNLKLSLGLKP